MPLPPSVLPSKTITVGETEYTIRSLSRMDAVKFSRLAVNREEGDAEAVVIASAFDVSEDEATTWLSTTDPLTADIVLEEILQFSGLREVERREAVRQKADPNP